MTICICANCEKRDNGECESIEYGNDCKRFKNKDLKKESEEKNMAHVNLELLENWEGYKKGEIISALRMDSNINTLYVFQTDNKKSYGVFLNKSIQDKVKEVDYIKKVRKIKILMHQKAHEKNYEVLYEVGNRYLLRSENWDSMTEPFVDSIGNYEEIPVEEEKKESSEKRLTCKCKQMIAKEIKKQLAEISISSIRKDK